MQATYLAGLLGASALGVTVGLGVAAHPVQDTQTEAARGTQEASTDEMEPWMAAMMAAGAVGENHRALAPMVGEFDATMTWTNPDGTQDSGEAKWTAQWAMGDRFVEGRFEMDWQGMPFEGRCLVGYSNLDEAFKQVWLDNMSTNLFYSAGFASEDGNTITFLGADPDPVTGQIKETESVYEFADADHFSFTSYVVNDGERGDMEMQISYARR